MSEKLTLPNHGMHPGQRIREAREALNLGQEALADHVGIARTTLSAVENGKRDVSATELLRFADALGRPFEYFLRRDTRSSFDFQPLLRVGDIDEGAAAPRRGRPPRGDGRSAIRQVLVKFEELCRMYLELEEMSGLPVPVEDGCRTRASEPDRAAGAGSPVCSILPLAIRESSATFAVLVEGEGVMSACAKLFHADQIYAYFNAAEKLVIILADVTANPVADDVHICPNLIAIPPSREFVVSGTTKGGIVPALLMKRRVSTSFHSDSTPRSVIVYSAGIDRPVRQEVLVGSQPPAPLGGLPDHESQAEASRAHGPVEVTGFSATFSLEQAVQDALAQAAGAFPAPPRNPDVAVEIDIKDIFARSGGNIRPGLFIRATAK